MMSRGQKDTRHVWRKPTIITIKRHRGTEEVILGACKGDGGSSYMLEQSGCQWDMVECYACVSVTAS